MSKKVIGILVGSLRRDSFSKKIANFIIGLAPADFELKIIELGDLPIYNQDYDDDGNVPQSYTRFREELKSLDGFLFITPEYNRSVPAVLKNALDVGSRPYGQSVWDGKPGGIVSVSPGQLSAFGANHHLRQSMVFLNVLMLQQPEAYIGNVAAILDEKGDVVAERSIEFLKNYVAAYVKWVNLIANK
ncbi:MAG: NADPH-dependent FMN reductase [Dysgonomonas sp.]